MRNRRVGRAVVLMAAVVLAAATLAHGAAKRGTIDTLAGTGNPGHSGDGGPARKAELNYPESVAVDSKGNVYIAEALNSRVRKVRPNGRIGTFAGSGLRGFSGDGGLARRARLYNPYAVAVDRHDNVYIADTNNYRVRKVNRRGIIKTVAGNGKIGDVSPIRPNGDGGAARKASLGPARGLVVDSDDNLYVNVGSRIRKVTPNGRITTIAGNGRFGYSGDGGPARQAQINSGLQVAADKRGNLYFADWLNHRIRKINLEGIITTFAGSGTAGFSGDGGPATAAELENPYGVTVDGKGNVYISDTINCRIRKVNGRGTITTIAGDGCSRRIGLGEGDGGPAKRAKVDPQGLSVDREGNLLIADTASHRVRIVYRAHRTP